MVTTDLPCHYAQPRQHNDAVDMTTSSLALSCTLGSRSALVTSCPPVSDPNTPSPSPLHLFPFTRASAPGSLTKNFPNRHGSPIPPSTGGVRRVNIEVQYGGKTAMLHILLPVPRKQRYGTCHHASWSEAGITHDTCPNCNHTAVVDAQGNEGVLSYV